MRNFITQRIKTLINKLVSNTSNENSSAMQTRQIAEYAREIKPFFELQTVDWSNKDKQQTYIKRLSRTPIGLVKVELNAGRNHFKVGWSLCHIKDRRVMHKQTFRTIADNRLHLAHFMPLNYEYIQEQRKRLPQSLHATYDRIMSRIMQRAQLKQNSPTSAEIDSNKTKVAVIS